MEASPSGWVKFKADVWGACEGMFSSHFFSVLNTVVEPEINVSPQPWKGIAYRSLRRHGPAQ